MMPVRLFITLFFFSFFFSLSAQNRSKIYQDYIDTYSPIAVEHMKKYKIPASITLAQGLFESGAGQSKLAKKSNNHFGIKCGGNWTGKTVKHTDDAPNECFRAYRHPKESYKDHAEFLTSRPRYESLFKLRITDYKGWAHGLKKAGYATDPSYANRLIKIIEDYELHKYDRKGAGKDLYKGPEPEFTHEIYLTNGLLYVVAQPGDTFKSIAKEFNTRASNLIGYNDYHKKYVLKPGDIVFLKAKKRKADKSYKTHVVGGNDSMHSISQKYGIRLKNLYQMNKKDPVTYSPQVGEQLKLR